MTGKWYEEFYNELGEKYDNEPYTRGTKGEVDFIEHELNHDRSKRVLDVGCGTGRHSLELARRGYTVVGIDLSRSLLERARSLAREEKLEGVEFIEGDARKLNFTDEFDMVISICEGAFSLMETDAMNYQILEGIYNALKDGGKFILTTLHAAYALTHELTGDFDIVTSRSRFTMEAKDETGDAKKFFCEERYYTCAEVNWLLKSIGFSRVEFFGCKLGAFNRNLKPSKNDFEILVVAEK
ncbi:MAG: class I SAM-dependent methyltransferase [Candidatus Verstraetearchaeota archaeon]|nr:class I SAM-dependent methyltransferase [Candidatus Verstraetearchaeota archaeon]